MKYLGGKQRLGKHIAPILKTIIKNNQNYKYYLEPFCGGLGVLRNLTDIKIPIYASDYHPDLIALFQAVRDYQIDLPDFITEKDYLYYKIKVKSPNAMKAFAGFGSSFGGRYFAAFAQKYLNGKKENFCLEAKRSLLRLQPTIKNVHFSCKDYRDLTPENAIIYCDPPYQFTKFPIKYRREVKKYDKFDNSEFWTIMREWSHKNIVIISETDAPSDFISFWEREKTRSICQSQKTRYKNTSIPKKVSEKLFIHKRHLSKMK
jgi:DNA adenine methylase